MAMRLMRLLPGPDSGDVGHARVEIALLARDALVDRVGDDVGEAPPVGWAGW